MNKILLLGENEEEHEKTKAYLELGGYEILEGDTNQINELSILFQIVHMILIECEEVAGCVEVCKNMREITDKPIMVLAKSGQEWEKVIMFQAGVNDYLAQNYLNAELIARMKAHIDWYVRMTKPSGVIKIRDMVINTFTRKVYLNDNLIHLRLKEFDILLYLAQHRDRVVTKEEIYHVIWKTDEFLDAYSNTVVVHVKRIREKIEKDIDNPQYLETVWGVGYRFVG